MTDAERQRRRRERLREKQPPNAAKMVPAEELRAARAEIERLRKTTAEKTTGEPSSEERKRLATLLTENIALKRQIARLDHQLQLASKPKAPKPVLDAESEAAKQIASLKRQVGEWRRRLAHAIEATR
jgi:hypothetical protein